MVEGSAKKHVTEEFRDELSPGTKLLSGQYTITRYLNSGGFGITYLAKDSLDRDVVIKECFPDSICRRNDATVRPRSRAHQASFGSVVELFIKEARSQAKLNHPNIAGIHQVFNDNDTAYMAIDYIDGVDLLDKIEDTKSITPENVELWLRKSLSAVGFIHENGMLHRDISPDNILINSKNEPILIDFGAARENASQTSRALSTLRVVKDGYSPQEFYIQGSEQNASSDLYALAATFYHVIRGEAPTDSQARLAKMAQDRQDYYEPLAGNVEGFPENLLKSIDKALRLLPNQRFQSADEWFAMLDGKEPEIALDAAAEITVQHVAAAEPTVEPVAAAEPTVPAASEKSKMPLLLGGGAIAAMIAVGVFYVINRKEATAPSLQIATTEVEAGEQLVADATKVAVDASAVIEIKPVLKQPEKPVEVALLEPKPEPVNPPAQPEAKPPLNYSDVVSSAEWGVALPFETSEYQAAEGTFSKVWLVSPKLPADVAAWLHYGTIIYAVDGNLVYNNASIHKAIIDQRDLKTGDPISAKLRVKADKVGRIQEHLVEFTPGYTIEMYNGTRFTATKTADSNWITTVSLVPMDLSDALHVGDVVVSEANSGAMVKGQSDIEDVFKTLVDNQNEVAKFTVARKGELEFVEFPLRK